MYANAFSVDWYFYKQGWYHLCIILDYSYDTNAFFTGTNINKVDRICIQSNINDFNISTTHAHTFNSFIYN